MKRAQRWNREFTRSGLVASALTLICVLNGTMYSIDYFGRRSPAWAILFFGIAFLQITSFFMGRLPLRRATKWGLGLFIVEALWCYAWLNAVFPSPAATRLERWFLRPAVVAVLGLGLYYLNQLRLRRARRARLLPEFGGGTMRDVERLAADGEIIWAIKIYREIHPVGLMEAKETVERMHRRVHEA